MIRDFKLKKGATLDAIKFSGYNGRFFVEILYYDIEHKRQIHQCKDFTELCTIYQVLIRRFPDALILISGLSAKIEAALKTPIAEQV